MVRWGAEGLSRHLCISGQIATPVGHRRRCQHFGGCHPESTHLHQLADAHSSASRRETAHMKLTDGEQPLHKSPTVQTIKPALTLGPTAKQGRSSLPGFPPEPHACFAADALQATTPHSGDIHSCQGTGAHLICTVACASSVQEPPFTEQRASGGSRLGNRTRSSPSMSTSQSPSLTLAGMVEATVAY